MAIESVSRAAGAAAYHAGSVSQNRHVEQVQASAAAVMEAQPVVQAQTVQAVTADNGGNLANGKNSQQNIEKDNEKVKKAVSDLNKTMNNTSCQFGIHEATGRVTIKIVDKETKDIIKEFPAEETLDLIAKVWELAGIMVDEKL